MHKLTNAVFGVAVLLLFGAVLTLGAPGAAQAQDPPPPPDVENDPDRDNSATTDSSTSQAPITGGPAVQTPVMYVYTQATHTSTMVNPATGATVTTTVPTVRAVRIRMLAAPLATGTGTTTITSGGADVVTITHTADTWQVTNTDGTALATTPHIAADLGAATQTYTYTNQGGETQTFEVSRNARDGSVEVRAVTGTAGNLRKPVVTAGATTSMMNQDGTTTSRTTYSYQGFTFQVSTTSTPDAYGTYSYDATADGTDNAIAFQVKKDANGYYIEHHSTTGAVIADDAPADTPRTRVDIVQTIDGTDLTAGQNDQVLKKDDVGNYWLVYGVNDDGSLKVAGLGPDGMPNTEDDTGNANKAVKTSGDLAYKTVHGDNIANGGVSREHLDTELDDAIFGDDGLGQSVQDNADDIADNAAAIGDRSMKTTSLTEDVDANREDIDANAAAIGDRSMKTTSLTEDVDANRADIDTNTAAIGDRSMKTTSLTEDVDAAAASASAAMTLAGNNQTDISMLREQIDDLEDDLEDMAAGVAMSLAMTNIPQLVGDQTFSVGVGVGFYDSEGAGAIGVNARLGDNAVGRASLAFGGGEVGGGAGVSFSW